jgi:hypothetical protein
MGEVFGEVFGEVLGGFVGEGLEELWGLEELGPPLGVTWGRGLSGEIPGVVP